MVILLILCNSIKLFQKAVHVHIIQIHFKISFRSSFTLFLTLHSCIFHQFIVPTAFYATRRIGHQKTQKFIHSVARLFPLLAHVFRKIHMCICILHFRCNKHNTRHMYTQCLRSYVCTYGI